LSFGVPGVDFTVSDLRGTFPDELEVRPLAGPVDATVPVPGSKSVTNRALLVAALAAGQSTVRNALLSDDSYWLLEALRRLGFEVRADLASGTATVGGRGGEIPAESAQLFVGNAGTVARFLPPALALGQGTYRVDGVPRMRERPIEDLVDALRSLGARVDYAEGAGRFPILVRGGGLRGGRVQIDGSRSSQFLSGLLLAAPYAAGPLEIEVTGPRRERPYVGITLDVMHSFGVEAEPDPDYARFRVTPATYQPRAYTVEPDASGASYFLAAAALTGGRVRVPDLGSGSTQGDLRFVEVLSHMGCEVDLAPDYTEVRGPDRLRGVDVDMNAFSDTMMTLAALAPFAEGPTTIRNVEHTRLQETDRISAVATELKRLGVEVEEYQDGLCIIPGEVQSAVIDTYEDHRMAMAFALVGLRVPGVRIRGPGCVTKTFPDYFERLGDLG
jgi:3-phosphoshikimate 1-carboxyvinyltransferase